MYDKNVGKRIRELREIHNISQVDAAEKSGIGLATLVQIENGRYPVSSESLIKLCKLYGASSDYILGLADMPTGQYKMDVRELYQKSYEQYLVMKKSPDYVTENYIKGKKPIADWPYNFIEACEIDIDFPISEIQYEGLKEIIDHKLTVKEGACVCAYYMKHMTLEQLADEFEVTKERIRQILQKAARKTKHPARANLIKYGVNYAAVNRELKEVNAKLAEIEDKKKIIEKMDEKYCEDLEFYKSKPLTISLIDLDLSVRSYNCIARYVWSKFNIDKKYILVRDIIPLFQSGEIVGIRNLGRKSYEEIRNKLIEIGIPSEELTPTDELFKIAAVSA